MKEKLGLMGAVLTVIGLIMTTVTVVACIGYVLITQQIDILWTWGCFAWIGIAISFTGVGFGFASIGKNPTNR